MLPRIAVGVALLAAGEILRLIAEPSAPILAGITPPTEALPGFAPLGSAFDAFATSIGLFGLVYLVRGLDEARRFDDEGSSRRFAIPLVVLGLAIGIGKFVRLGQLPVDDTLTVGTVVAVSLILSTLDLLAWAYLIVIGARGWRSGDAPSRGWLAAMLACDLHGLPSVCVHRDRGLVPAADRLRHGSAINEGRRSRTLRPIRR